MSNEAWDAVERELDPDDDPAAPEVVSEPSMADAFGKWPRKLTEAEIEKSLDFLRDPDGTQRQLASQSEQIARLTRERDRAREFVEWAMRDGSWKGYDIDGGDAQDKAEELGLIVEVPADAEFRAEYDADTMYVCAWAALATLPSTPENE